MTIRGEYMRSLLSCVIITFSLLVSTSSQAKCGATEGEVGFFLREHTSCFVSNADGSGRRKCGEGCGLAPGDIITVDPAIAANQFDIKWVSGHARIELIFPNNYKVFYDPPQNRHKIVAAVQEMLGFTHERMQRWTITTATRKTNDTGNAQLPGSVSTLITGYPFKFLWCGEKARRVVITDSTGNPVFAQTVKGLQSLVITPEKMGLKKGESYSWEVEGSHCSGEQLRLLEGENESVVIDAFAKIAGTEKLSDNDKVLAKAAFVQFLSESYPDDVALNWLCYELTDTLEQKSVLNDEKLMIRYLKERSGIRPCK